MLLNFPSFKECLSPGEIKKKWIIHHLPITVGRWNSILANDILCNVFHEMGDAYILCSFSLFFI